MVAVRCWWGTAGSILVTTALPVGPDAWSDLDVGKVGQLVRKGQRVGTVALRVALGGVCDHMELLDLAGDWVCHAGRVGLLDKRFWAAGRCGARPLDTISVVALLPVARRVWS